MQDKSFEYGMAVILDALRKIFKNFAIVLISRPSTGKGKLASFLEGLGFNTISCSGALTEMAHSEPENPAMIELLQKMNTGEFIEKDLVLRAIKMKLAKKSQLSAVVFDGFPRECDQAVDLQNILVELKIPYMTLDLICTRTEANVRRLSRIKEALQSGNPARNDDIDVHLWTKRQDQYDKRYPALIQKLKDMSYCIGLDTSSGDRRYNHGRALVEILRFATSLL